MTKITTEISAIVKETPFKEDVWKIRRRARIDEVEMANGSMRFRVTVWDEGRPPFIVQWFNDPVPAADFLDRLMDQAVS